MSQNAARRITSAWVQRPPALRGGSFSVHEGTPADRSHLKTAFGFLRGKIETMLFREHIEVKL